MFDVSTTYADDKDVNCIFNIPTYIDSDRVRLVPFNPQEHAEAFFTAADNIIWRYVYMGPYESTDDFIEGYWTKDFQRQRDRTVFTIVDKASSQIAGIVCYLNSSYDDMFTEIGTVFILPQFRRSHVTSHTVGLLLFYALDTDRGLGLRRVSWVANANNDASVNCAKRMGFQMEGIMRWIRVISSSKTGTGNGVKARQADRQADCEGRDSALLSFCWDDWENGGKAKVEQIMNRKS